MTQETVTILHNPRCSKSRLALALLKERGLALEIIHYLENPPGINELQSLLDALGMTARQLLRRNEALYKVLSLDDPKHTQDTLLRTMLQHPVLIERPIVYYRGKAVIGRPPEAVLRLFDPS